MEDIPRRGPGYPTTYCQTTAIQICTRLVEGESLRSVCRDPAMPAISTVFLWLQAHPEFREQYDLARDAQADTLADEILFIADNPQIGTRSVTKPSGVEVHEGDMIEHRRLQVDARKWVASKLKPRRYGEKLESTLRGDAAAPIMISATDGKL